jgi:hypothetical protein
MCIYGCEGFSFTFMASTKSPQRKRASSQTSTVKISEARRRDSVAKAAGGPNDKAVYKCSCGNEFEAAVSTSVQCPNCGTGQAW